ncbi:MAG: hypothetical protein A3B13_01140 [Candidatus Liptonbacteria bacterium RIFCSPLOWO2_01_FULL_45_15]|uniref:Uncharacterized protein n=1 Tax=Candidatus Liptonbacteria bacterium RIFCSPLOWO2_01_FULL_45_15 TaxID=1798649 RepID=A0A1G2CFZ8_9BACT|nr:MAG: hypothetical protein A3B13_01140 [Candidatus Liptonbacteria bacterium RIFCSPLOWO2_01_FULL_45_15]
MVTISISPKIIKQRDVVVIPRSEYEALLRSSGVSDKAKKLPTWLQESLRDVETGKITGPFRSAKELMAHLEK